MTPTATRWAITCSLPSPPGCGSRGGAGQTPAERCLRGHRHLRAGRDPAERLIENADMAMYRAKQQGRGRFCFFDVGMHLDAQRRANLEADLHLAIANGEIACHLQRS